MGMMKKIQQTIKSLWIKLQKRGTTTLRFPLPSWFYVPSQVDHKKYLYIVRQYIRPFHYNWIMKSCLHYLKNSNVVRSYTYKREPDFFLCKTIRKIKTRNETHMVALKTEEIQDIKSIEKKLDNFSLIPENFNAKNGEKKEIARKLIEHEFLIKNISKQITKSWEDFGNDEGRVVNKFLPKTDEMIDIICNQNEREENKTIQKCLSRLLKSLKNLKTVLEDTLQFKSIASDARALIQDNSDYERLDFAKRIIADARVRAKEKRQ